MTVWLGADPDALHEFGVDALRRADSETAIAVLERALDLAPGHAASHAALGLGLQAAGRSTEALAALRRGVYLDPTLAGAHNAIGTECLARGQPMEALQAFVAAKRARPDFVAADINRGLALQQMGRAGDAQRVFEAVIAGAPDLAAAHHALGTVLHAQFRPQDAATCYRRAITLDPDYASAHGNLGRALRDLGDVTGAMTHYDTALSLDPNYADAHWNRALLNLLTGHFAEGWREQEWRWQVKGFPSRRRPFAAPLWQGEDISGARILLHAEQGLGDTIQFLRYVPLVAARGAAVLLEVQSALAPLAERLPGLASLVRHGEPMPAFDWHVPLLSLPRAFGTTLGTIPADVPYLSADARRLAHWRQRIDGAAGNPEAHKVGLVWAGRPTHSNDANRSLAPAALAPLLEVDGVSFFSLQVGATGLPPGVIDLADGFGDFAETAAAIACLDLVITVDTSVAHLAGAMGKPVWILIPFAPDWRWLVGRDDSPWYPTMRLYRQPRLGDWSTVLARVARDLAALHS